MKALELPYSREEELSGKRTIIESDSANVINWMLCELKFHGLFNFASRFSSALVSVKSFHVLREGI
jgi:hypothetical protein